MFRIEENEIHITRGDTCSISFFAEDTDGHDYMFQPGEIVRFKVTEKKNTSNVVLQKDFLIKEVCTCIDIILTSEDTKIGELINKPTTYWYEIELDPDGECQTLLGYDDEGAKLFTLYPEGGDGNV